LCSEKETKILCSLEGGRERERERERIEIIERKSEIQHPPLFLSISRDKVHSRVDFCEFDERSATPLALESKKQKRKVRKMGAIRAGESYSSHSQSF
jgi:hypothetical protein